MQQLTIIEQNELERCEVVIKQGLQTFVEVGQALLTIRDKRLYRIEFGTFEDYCRERWGMVASRARQLIGAVNVVENLVSVTIVTPQSESQARPLTQLTPEIQREAWREVVEENGDSITAAKVSEVVERWKPVDEVYRNKVDNNRLSIFTPDYVGRDELLEQAKEHYKPHVSNNSGDNEWYTPAQYIETARRVLGQIHLDPASSHEANKVVGASCFYTIETNGLEQVWGGQVWLNPPYAQPLVAQFCEKLCSEYEAGNVTEAILLVNNATETAWFQNAAAYASAFCFPRGRVKFWKPGSDKAAPLQGQCFMYFGDNTAQFIQCFNEHGLTVLI